MLDARLRQTADVSPCRVADGRHVGRPRWSIATFSCDDGRRVGRRAAAEVIGAEEARLFFRGRWAGGAAPVRARSSWPRWRFHRDRAGRARSGCQLLGGSGCVRLTELLHSDRDVAGGAHSPAGAGSR